MNRTRWIPHRPGRGPAVRKILRAIEATRLVYRVSVISFLLALIGIIIYIYVYPSDIILFEAFVWLIEAISFTGIAVALKIASSRTQIYGERYEIFRIEALSSLTIALIALLVTGVIVYKTIAGGKGYTPVILSLYPLLSALASFILEKNVHSGLKSLEVKIASIKVVADKLRYDVLIELTGGIAIILSNIVESDIVERSIVVLVAAYVSYGLIGISYSNLLYLVGPGPQAHREEIRRKIVSNLKQAGYRPRRIRVEVYGTFAEAEVWIELDPGVSLAKAHSNAVDIAKMLVHNIPELLRVIVVTVPLKKHKVYMKRARIGESRRVVQVKSSESEKANISSPQTTSNHEATRS